MRLLIAHSSEWFTDMLTERLQADMEIWVCHDGTEVLDRLHSIRPDAMILDLHLPRKDGMTILRQAQYVPRVILGIVGFGSYSLQQMAYALGVSQLVLMPSVNSIVLGLMTLLQQAQDPRRKPDLRERARFHLQNLNVPPHLDGYKQLTVALPLFAADPHQTLSKELYPAVAQIMGGDWRTVEHSIRTAITDTWLNRDPEIWARYFPEGSDCPNNKRFLCRLAEIIEKE